jgi:hypothetical protein
MAYGQAGSMLKYFQDKIADNPSFQYALQMDCEEQITNIFLADAKMIMDYAHFCDVVSVDTTFGTNKESRPFGVFVGFNHFRETVVFGAALMYDETYESFKWLFETFLKASPPNDLLINASLKKKDVQTKSSKQKRTWLDKKHKARKKRQNKASNSWRV